MQEEEEKHFYVLLNNQDYIYTSPTVYCEKCCTEKDLNVKYITLFCEPVMFIYYSNYLDLKYQSNKFLVYLCLDCLEKLKISKFSKFYRVVEARP